MVKVVGGMKKSGWNETVVEVAVVVSGRGGRR